MSIVTGLTLIVHPSDDDMPPVIDQWLRKRDGAWSLGTDLTAAADGDRFITGGNKHPQVRVYCAGLNHFWYRRRLVANFVAMFKALPWRCEEYAVLILTPEDAEAKVFRPSPRDNLPPRTSCMERRTNVAR